MSTGIKLAHCRSYFPGTDEIRESNDKEHGKYKFTVPADAT